MFWDRMRTWLRATFLHSPTAVLATAMGTSEAIIKEQYPDYPPSVGEMASSVVGVVEKVGSWIKGVLILMAVILALYFLIGIKK